MLTLLFVRKTIFIATAAAAEWLAGTNIHTHTEMYMMYILYIFRHITSTIQQ